MKRNTKGFTLIELLAVIVVLAIIALIATPIVLNLINQAREGAARESVTSYMKAVENSVLKEMVDSENANKKFCATYEISGTTLTGSGSDCIKTLTVDVSGKTPTKGTVSMNSDGSNITAVGVTSNGYDKFYYTQKEGTKRS